MFLALVLLAQTAAATPAPARTPAPAPTAIPRSDGANSGLAGAASKVKLNRNVSFGDLNGRTPAPRPSAAMTPAGPATAPATAPDGCNTQSFVPGLDDAVSRFRDELGTARSTPRVALAAQITQLRGVRNEVQSNRASAPACASDAVAAALKWMDVEIRALDLFLGKDEKSSLALDPDRELAEQRYVSERSRLP